MIRCSTFEQRIRWPAHVHSKPSCFCLRRSFSLRLSRFSSAHVAAAEGRTKSETSDKSAQHTRVKISPFQHLCKGNDAAKFVDGLQSARRAVDMRSLLCCCRFSTMISQIVEWNCANKRDSGLNARADDFSENSESRGAIVSLCVGSGKRRTIVFGKSSIINHAHVHRAMDWWWTSANSWWVAKKVLKKSTNQVPMTMCRVPMADNEQQKRKKSRLMMVNVVSVRQHGWFCVLCFLLAKVKWN